MINGHCVQIIHWTGYIKTIFKRARVNQNQGAYMYKRPDQNIYAPVSGIPRTPLPGNSGALDQGLALIHANSPLYGPLSLT